MTQLAIANEAVNLGQGFPNFEGPAEIKQIAVETIQTGNNQYVRPWGELSLVHAISEHQARFYDLRYDPLDEVTVYNGATEAIFASLIAILNPGDEVVIFEPYYDSYRASIAMAGGQERIVTLRAPEFSYRPEDLEAAINDRTRCILLNTPHNPSGKVFSPGELAHIAELARRHDLLVLSDEVYEHLVFEGAHIPIATLPGMRERTITISSAGKSFSFTGWKVGHTCAPAEITRALRTSHQFVTFCNSGPLQPAVAAAYRLDDEYFQRFIAEYRVRRDVLCGGLESLGFGVLVPAGTYFVTTDIRPLGYDDDLQFCRMLPERFGVAAIPNSAFYENKDEGKHLVRWAFCKTMPMIEQALKRLEGLRPKGRA
jgi:N-succinyldiaminopimelate aminotransferase